MLARSSLADSEPLIMILYWLAGIIKGLTFLELNFYIV